MNKWTLVVAALLSISSVALAESPISSDTTAAQASAQDARESRAAISGSSQVSRGDRQNRSSDRQQVRSDRRSAIGQALVNRVAREVGAHAHQH
jgi:hypothetical protein